MTKNQKEILKKLGYEDADEDGAILRHSKWGYNNNGLDRQFDMIWPHTEFDDVLAGYTEWVVGCAKRDAIRAIKKL